MMEGRHRPVGGDHVIGKHYKIRKEENYGLDFGNVYRNVFTNSRNMFFICFGYCIHREVVECFHIAF